MSGNNPLRYLADKDGGGWIGYRGLFAIIFASGQIALLMYWVTYTGVTLGAGMVLSDPYTFGIWNFIHWVSSWQKWYNSQNLLNFCSMEYLTICFV